MPHKIWLHGIWVNIKKINSESGIFWLSLKNCDVLYKAPKEGRNKVELLQTHTWINKYSTRGWSFLFPSKPGADIHGNDPGKHFSRKIKKKKFDSRPNFSWSYTDLRSEKQEESGKGKVNFRSSVPPMSKYLCFILPVTFWSSFKRYILYIFYTRCVLFYVWY